MSGVSITGIGVVTAYLLLTPCDPPTVKDSLQTSQYTKTIAELIRQHFCANLSSSSLCRLLNQMGLSAQSPMWGTYHQGPGAVHKWVEGEYPKIRSRERKIKAEIHFGDESSVRSDFHSGATWGKRCRTQIVSSIGTRFNACMASAVSPRDMLSFMIAKGRVTAKVFINSLQRFLAYAPVFPVVDGHPEHKAKSVRRFVESRERKLELYYLPSY